MNEFYLIAGALLMSGAIALSLRNTTPGAVAAYAGAWALSASGYAPVSQRLLLFWAIAVLIVVSISMTRRKPLEAPSRLRYFIIGGALAGMAAGLTFHQAGAIIGSACGVILGAIACNGLGRRGDTASVARLTVAIGLPAVVIMSLIATSILGILARTSGL